MLTAYRRHLAGCDSKDKGQSYTLCACPIWAYGEVNGARIRKSLQTVDAARALRLIEQIERGDIEVERKVPDTEAAATEFIASCRDRNLRESTLSSYANTLKPFTAQCGKLPVNAIDTVTLDAYRRERKIAPGTWRKELETLRAFFAWCGERGWCDTNPGRKLKMPKSEDLTTLPFTSEDVGKLLAATSQIFSDNPAETDYIRRRAKALVYLLLYSGLRISDVAPMKRSMLEPRTRHLTIRILKNGVRLKVLLHQSAVDALTSLPATNPAYFFWTGKGEIQTCIGNLRRTVQRLGVLADVHAHPHRFRDTFAVELLTNGADIRTVQKLLGHTSVRTTEKHYAHFVAAHQALLDSAAATLDFERASGSGPLLVKPLHNRRRNA
ncbi:MAG: phage integrase family protein [Bryobacterales bacterium]|nr:phage integrase family protein [Bryobacterales bacterium]